MRAAAVLIALAFAAVIYVPIAQPELENEPDLSFRTTTHDAFARRLQQGSEIVSTYGPWGLLQRGYDPRTDTVVLAVSVLLAVAFAWGTTRLANDPAVSLATALVATLIVAAGTEGDVRFSVLPILLMLSTFLPPSRARELPLVAILGVIALMKFSLLLLAVFAVGIVGLTRRSFVAPAVFLGSFLAAWMAAGQRLGGIPLFLWRQAEVGRGYAAASSAGPPAFFAIAAALGLVAIVAYFERRLLPVVAMAGSVAWIAMVGYTRDDLMHAAAADALLLILIAGYLFICRRFAIAGIAAALIAIIAGGPIFAHDVAADRAWMRNRSERLAALQDELRKQSGADAVPRVDGTIDAYAWGSAALIVRRMHYTPRPVFQSAMAWTAKLAEINADFLRGPRAPQWLWVSVGSIDQRFPLLDDAPSWLEMLRRYDVASTVGDHVLLRKRAVPRAVVVTPVVTATASELLLPPGLLWCSIDGEATSMETVTAGGTHARWRIVPAMARGGFLLSLAFPPDAHDRIARIRLNAKSVVRISEVRMPQAGG